MIKCPIIFFIFIVCIVYCTKSYGLPAFPGAEGFGTDTVHGRGGSLCQVTNTNDNTSAGSLRYCLSVLSGSRIIVFRVGGTITLTSPISVTSGNIYIAGQTAPGGGIQIKDWPIKVVGSAGNIVMRHMRLRRGEGTDTTVDEDSFNLLTTGSNIVVDHSSFEYGLDENFGMYGGSLTNVTISWSIIAEASKGLLCGMTPVTQNITIHHTLFANNDERNPYCNWDVGIDPPEPSVQLDMRNNVIYGWGPEIEASQIGYSGVTFSTAEGYHANFVNNTWVPNTGVSWEEANMGFRSGAGEVYLSGNRGSQCPSTPCSTQWDLVNTGSSGTFQVFSEHDFPDVTTQSSSTSYGLVLENAGAMPRDSLDARVIDEVETNTGTIGPDSFEYPTIANGTPYTDTDSDGMSDTWETTCNGTLGTLNPNSATDGDDIISGVDASVNGYSHVEVFLNAMAGDYGTDGLTTCANLLEADTTDPVVTITAPTSNTTYSTATTPITTIAGTAIDAVGTTIITWTNAATSGSGSGSGCSGETSCNWSVSSISLNEGSNAITITGADAASNEGTDTITVTLDTTPPSRSNGSPSGTLDAGTTSTSISLNTNETATCKYGTSAGVAYGSLPNTFSSTNSTSHSTSVSSLSDGNSYTYYIRCQDSLSNANTDDFTISFSVDTPPSIFPNLPTSLSTTASSTASVPTSPTSLSTTASSTVSVPTSPTSLSTTASSTVIFPSVPTGVSTP